MWSFADFGGTTMNFPDRLDDELLAYAGRHYAAKRNGDVKQAAIELRKARTQILAEVERAIGTYEPAITRPLPNEDIEMSVSRARRVAIRNSFRLEILKSLRLPPQGGGHE